MVIGGWGGGKNDDSETTLKEEDVHGMEQKIFSMNYDARLEMRFSNWIQWKKWKFL